ncbi:MAG: flagellin [Firmicutes bacterium]|nr:flagellin [Bacillota bacterium]
MRINHNIAALNTYRQLGQANKSQQNSMEKLSSGLRINRAGDDAAGLAISEKMRGQIRGLEQAERNSQDGISLIQTAEGALNETHSILQRMRELSVQAANDTATTEDRGEIQKELDQLVEEIDRIGNTTEFNTRNLIDGTQSQQADVTAGGTNIQGAEAINAMDEGTYTVQVEGATATADNISAAGSFDDAADIAGFGASVNIGDSFQLVVSGYSAGNTAATLTLQDAEGNQIAQLTNQDVSSGFSIGGTDGFSIAGGAIDADGTASFDFAMEAATITVSKGGTQIAQETNVVSSDGDMNAGGFGLTVDNTLGNASASIEVSGAALQLQIGANEDQSMRVAIGDMRSSALNINDLDVSSYDTAKQAVTSISTAIEDVSAERSKLGAYQNRLEHTINNLGTASENLTASESRIRDVDMAREMMQQTKASILSQASQAMLAKANQQPQAVLQLLR